MQITIAGGQGAEAEGSSRKVARDVDMENFTVLDQVIKKHLDLFKNQFVK